MRFPRPLAVMLCCLSPLALAQKKTSVPAPHPAVAQPSTAGPITLDVVVSGKNDVPVSGLQQQDFTLDVDKKSQPITSFRAVQASSASAEPIETILLIDTINTRFDHVAYERQQIEQFLKQNGGHLAQPVSLVVLTDSGTRIMPQPTRDGTQLAKFLDQSEANLRIIGDDTGFYGAVERFQTSINALKQLTDYEIPRPGRKLLIWISPGWPLLSGPNVELTQKDQKGLFNTAVDLAASMRKARITLSSVDPLGTTDSGTFRTFFYEEFVKGVPTANKMQIGNLALQVLALQSGGIVLNSNNDIAKEISTAASEAQAFYVLTFNSAPTTRPDDYRPITVHVDKSGLTARTRSGYYAQP